VRICLAAILLLAALPANAQQLDPQGYRTGLPSVMAPMGNQAPIDDGTVARFRQAYAARKSPRIMAFWNRELDDRVSSAENSKRMWSRGTLLWAWPCPALSSGDVRPRTNAALGFGRYRDATATRFRGAFQMGVRSCVFPGFLRSRSGFH